MFKDNKIVDSGFMGYKFDEDVPNVELSNFDGEKSVLKPGFADKVNDIYDANNVVASFDPNAESNKIHRVLKQQR